MRYHVPAACVTRLQVTFLAVQPKRRLPVLNSPAAEEPASRRPWQWVGFGALAIFTAWIPLSALAGWLAVHLSSRASEADEGRLASAGAAIALLHALALALGSGLGGFLVGKWGPQGIGVRHAALSGLSAAAVAVGATSAAFGFSPATLLLAAVSPAMAALGGRVGVKRRGP